MKIGGISGVVDHADGLHQDQPLGRDNASAWEALNRSAFKFRHRLENHPLFEISRLAKIAESVTNNKKLYVTSDEDLNGLPVKRRFAESLRRIEGGSHWLKLSGLQEVHPDYNELLQTFLLELEDLTGLPVRRTATWAGLTVFIASPKMITPYHFDHDTNFLFQIEGEKDAYLFDPTDKSVLTEDEIEHFYRGEAMAGKYRDELIGKGQAFCLTPGTAVHHPPLAPHLIKNRNNVSLSVSMFYADSSLDIRARVYQANYCLRRLGLQPRPPGASPVSDRLKSMAIGALSKSNPKTQDELLYSGIKRIFLPYRVGSWIVQRALSGPPSNNAH